MNVTLRVKNICARHFFKKMLCRLVEERYREKLKLKKP